MPHLKFNHVFFGLMLLSILSAFVFSARVGDKIRSQFANVFIPVAWPANRVGGWIHQSIAGSHLRDDGSPNRARSDAQLLDENLKLRVTVASLMGQMEHLREVAAERAVMGAVLDHSTPMGVVGADSGPRESLMLNASSMTGLKEGMPVISSSGGAQGFVGVLSRVGMGEARVQLITDPQWNNTAQFVRFTKKSDGTVEYTALSAQSFLVNGAGAGELVISTMTEAQKQEVGVELNDWLVLRDSALPMLRNYRLGYVWKIAPSRNPGFVEIRVKPDRPLTELTEVWVLNK